MAAFVVVRLYHKAQYCCLYGYHKRDASDFHLQHQTLCRVGTLTPTLTGSRARQAAWREIYHLLFLKQWVCWHLHRPNY